MDSTQAPIPHPPMVSPDQWLSDRLKLLELEKALTRETDRVNALRRRLPMTLVDASYVFEGEEGERTLLELFEGQRQLIIYHFMYGPDWTAACPGCTSFIDAMGDMSVIGKKDARLVIVSRAPLEMLTRFKKEKGWTLPWYSSGRCRFNHDFKVTLDPADGPVSYNYATGEALSEGLRSLTESTEVPGISVFFRLEQRVYHTYSTFARGAEGLTDAVRLLDLAPYGRQEDFEDSPDGWPQQPTYG
jgi:predicted dithiol-disulfide oxidoreductase (DUF899 family)